jgi:predicted CopG family antitoxin
MPKKTITIDLETWQELTKLKADLNANSLDDVIRKMLEKWRAC